MFKLKYNVTQVASGVTGVSLIKTILLSRQAVTGKSDLFAVFPPTGKSEERKKKVVIDDFIRDIIRRKVHVFYAFKKAVSTLRKLNSVPKEGNIFRYSREFLRKTLKEEI